MCSEKTNATTSWSVLLEAVQMSTYNVCFCEMIRKIIFTVYQLWVRASLESQVG